MVLNDSLGGGYDKMVIYGQAVIANNILLNGLHDQAGPGSISGDSLFVSDLTVTAFTADGSLTSFGIIGSEGSYLDISNVTISNNSRSAVGIMGINNDGICRIRNLVYRDNQHFGTDEEFGGAAQGRKISSNLVDVDTLIFENNYVAWSGLATIRSEESQGVLHHVVFSGNQIGDGNYYGPPEGPVFEQSRMLNTNNCDYYDSRFVNNTSIITEVEPGAQNAISFGALVEHNQFNGDTVKIINCEFSNNTLIDTDVYTGPGHTANHGRALYLQPLESAGVIVRNCVFNNNLQPNHPFEMSNLHSLGSTVYVDGGGGLTHTPIVLFEGCQFTNNDDGALNIRQHDKVIVQNCNFVDNKRGSLAIASDTVRVSNVLISGNQAIDPININTRQSAFRAAANQQIEISNLTIVNCVGPNLISANWSGGPQSIFENCLFYNNDYDVFVRQYQPPEEDRDPAFNYCMLEESPPAGSNNLIGVNPLLDQNYPGQAIPSPASPCIDTGNPAYVYKDREDPENSGHPLWPSQGMFRNDIGYTGGPHAGILDNSVGIRPPTTEGHTQPASATLFPASANPFNPVTQIHFHLEQPPDCVPADS